jgi:hypothetical protein
MAHPQLIIFLQEEIQPKSSSIFRAEGGASVTKTLQKSITATKEPRTTMEALII